MFEKLKNFFKGSKKGAAKKKTKRSKPMRQPRYDDVYFEGLEWLDSLAEGSSKAVDASDFDSIAESNPKQLIRFLEAEQDIGNLTFAAEAAAGIEDSHLAVPVLLRLLEHESPIVREGIVYGLAGHIEVWDLGRAFKELVENDPSPGVREAAADALDDVNQFNMSRSGIHSQRELVWEEPETEMVSQTPVRFYHATVKQKEPPLPPLPDCRKYELGPGTHSQRVDSNGSVTEVYTAAMECVSGEHCRCKCGLPKEQRQEKIERLIKETGPLEIDGAFAFPIPTSFQRVWDNDEDAAYDEIGPETVLDDVRDFKASCGLCPICQEQVWYVHDGWDAFMSDGRHPPMDDPITLSCRCTVERAEFVTNEPGKGVFSKEKLGNGEITVYTAREKQKEEK